MPWTAAEGIADHAGRFALCLQEQAELCTALEALADALPSKVDTRAAQALAGRLDATLRRCHRLEEAVIFPALLRRDPGAVAMIDRLRREHVEDEDHAGDLREALAALAIGCDRREVEELGYLLRCLFTALRRHVAFDRDHVLPLCRAARRDGPKAPLPIRGRRNR